MHLVPASSGLSSPLCSARSVGQVGAGPLARSQWSSPQAHLSMSPLPLDPELHAVSNLFFLTRLKNGTFFQSNSCSLTSQLSLIKVMRCIAPSCSQGHSSQAFFTTSLPVLVRNHFHRSCVNKKTNSEKKSSRKEKWKHFILHILKKAVLFFNFSPIKKML